MTALAAAAAVVGAGVVAITPTTPIEIQQRPMQLTSVAQTVDTLDGLFNQFALGDLGNLFTAADPTDLAVAAATTSNPIAEALIQAIDQSAQFMSQAAIAVGFATYGLTQQLSTGLDDIATYITGLGSSPIFTDLGDVFTAMAESQTLVGQFAVDYASSGISPVIFSMASVQVDLVNELFNVLGSL